VRAGVQLHDVDASDGASNTSPYLELALDSQINTQFRVRGFARYGIENYDTVQFTDQGLAEFDDRRTLRIGISADYAISPMFSVFGGADYIPTSYQSGRTVSTPPFVGSIDDASEDMINLYVGLSVKFNDYLTGTATYNYTNSSSDLAGRDYDRNRISLGLSTEF
jgi:hypothetical protein